MSISLYSKIKVDLLLQYLFRYTNYEQFTKIINSSEILMDKAKLCLQLQTDNFDFSQNKSFQHQKQAIIRLSLPEKQIIDINAVKLLAQNFNMCQMLAIQANAKQIKQFVDGLNCKSQPQSQQQGQQQTNQQNIYKLQKVCINAFNTRKEELSLETIYQLFPPQLFQHITFLQCNIRFNQSIYRLYDYSKLQTLEITIDNDNIKLQDLLYFSSLECLTIRKMEFTLQEIIDLVRYCKYVDKIIIHTERVKLQEIPKDYQQFGDNKIKHLSINAIEGLQVLILSVLCKICNHLEKICYHGVLLRMTQEEQQQFKTKLFTTENKQKLEQFIKQQENELANSLCYDNQAMLASQVVKSTVEAKCLNINQYNDYYKENVAKSHNCSPLVSTHDHSVVLQTVEQVSQDEEDELIQSPAALPLFQYDRKNSYSQTISKFGNSIDDFFKKQKEINYEESSEDSKDSLTISEQDILFDEGSSDSEQKQEKQVEQAKQNKARETINNNRRNSEILDTLALRHRTTKEQDQDNSASSDGSDDNILQLQTLQQLQTNVQLDKASQNQSYTSEDKITYTNNQVSDNSTPMIDTQLSSSKTYSIQSSRYVRKDLNSLFADARKKLPKQVQKKNKTLIVDDIEKTLKQRKQDIINNKQHLRLSSLLKGVTDKNVDKFQDQQELMEQNHKVFTQLKNNLINSDCIRSRSNPTIIKQTKTQQLTLMRHVLTKQQKMLKDKYTNVRFRDELRKEVSKQMNMFCDRRKERYLNSKINKILNSKIITREQLNYLDQGRIDDLYYGDLQQYNQWQSNYDCEFNYLQDKVLQSNISQIPKIIQYYNNLQQLNFDEYDEIFYQPLDLQVEHKLEIACNYQINDNQLCEQNDNCQECQESLNSAMLQSEFENQLTDNPLFPKQWQNNHDNKFYIAQHTFSLSHVLLISLPQTIKTLNVQNTCLTKLDHILLSQLPNLQSLTCSNIEFHQNMSYRLDKLERLVITNGGLLDVKALSQVARNLKILSVSNVVFIHSSQVQDMQLIKLTVNDSPNLLTSQLRDVIMASSKSLRYLTLQNTNLPSLLQTDYLPSLYSINFINLTIQTNNIYHIFSQMFQIIKQSNVQILQARCKEQTFLNQQNLYPLSQHKVINYNQRIYIKIFVSQQLYDIIKESQQFQQEIEKNIFQVFLL